MCFVCMCGCPYVSAYNGMTNHHVILIKCVLISSSSLLHLVPTTYIRYGVFAATNMCIVHMCGERHCNNSSMSLLLYIYVQFYTAIMLSLGNWILLTQRMVCLHKYTYLTYSVVHVDVGNWEALTQPTLEYNASRHIPYTDCICALSQRSWER